MVTEVEKRESSHKKKKKKALRSPVAGGDSVSTVWRRGRRTGERSSESKSANQGE